MKNIIIILIFCMATCSCQSEMEKQYISDYDNNNYIEWPEGVIRPLMQNIMIRELKPSEYELYMTTGDRKHLSPVIQYYLGLYTIRRTGHYGTEHAIYSMRYAKALKIELKEILPTAKYEVRYK